MNRSIILLLHSLGVETDFFLEKQRQAKDLIDVELVKAKMAVYTEQMKSLDTLAPEMQRQLKAEMREMYQGILGGRKFHY